MKFLDLVVVFVSTGLVFCGLKEDDPEPERGVVPNRTHFGRPPAFDGYSDEDLKYRYLILVLIRRDDNISDCTGSLIKADLVLSSAHCFYYINVEPRDVLLVGGKADLIDFMTELQGANFYDIFDESVYGTQSIRGKEIFMPTEYDNDTLYHDIALVRGVSKFSPAKTKVIPWNVGKMSHKKECSIAAFGLATGYPPKPLVGYIDRIDAFPMHLKKCRGDYLSPFVCIKAESTGGCLENSGGPLICQGHIWGVGTIFNMEDCEDDSEMYYSALYIDREWLMSVYLEGLSSCINSDIVVVLSGIILTVLLKNNLLHLI